MNNEQYNGWSNYATWRVQLEIVDEETHNMLQNDERYFDSLSVDMIAEQIKDMVEELVHNYTKENENGIGCIIEGWTLAFLDDVNWTELAEHAKELSKEYVREGSLVS